MTTPSSPKDQPIIVKSEMGKFTTIPNAVDDADLTLHEFRVYVNLARRAGNDDGLAYPSYARIARDCFRSTYATASDATLRRMAITAIAGLVEKGMLVKYTQMRDNGSASSNIYTLTLPSKWAANQPEISKPAEPNTEEGGSAYAPPPEGADLGEGVVHMHQGGAYAPLEEDPIEEVKATTTTDTTAAPTALADESNQTTTAALTQPALTQTMTDPTQIYFSIFGRTPTSAERKMMHQRVTDLKAWEQSLTWWKKENRSPSAITRLLASYETYLNLSAGLTAPQKPKVLSRRPEPDYTLFDPRKFRETGLCATGTGETPYEIYRELTRNTLSMGAIRYLHNEIKPENFEAWRNTVTFWSLRGLPMNDVHDMLKNYYQQLGRAQPPPQGSNGFAAAAAQGKANDNQTDISPERAQLLAEIAAEIAAAQQSATAH